LLFSFGWPECKHSDIAAVFFDQLNCLLNGAFFVWTNGETQERSINLLTIAGDVDARARGWHTFDADENVHR